MKSGCIQIKDHKVYFEPDNENQLVEVNNYKLEFKDRYCNLLLSNSVSEYAWNGRLCKAEVTENKAIIIELR